MLEWNGSRRVSVVRWLSLPSLLFDGSSDRLALGSRFGPGLNYLAGAANGDVLTTSEAANWEWMQVQVQLIAKSSLAYSRCRLGDREQLHFANSFDQINSQPVPLI